MKKIVILFTLFLLSAASYSQVFNTAQTLKKGAFSLGVNPAIWDDELNLFLHAGYGLKTGVDLGFKYGAMDGDDYVGLDVEWSLKGSIPYISFRTGAYVINDLGLDLGLNFSFPVTGSTQIYTGLDTDIYFGDDVTTALWLPFGVDIALKKKMSLIIDAEIPLSDSAITIFGGGFSFYL